MLGLGWSELFVVAALGFILIKPHEFPAFFQSMYRLYKLCCTYMGHVKESFHEFAQDMDLEVMRQESFKIAQQKEQDPLETPFDESVEGREAS